MSRLTSITVTEKGTEMLKNYAKVATLSARDKRGFDHEDAAQEGLIRAWQILQKNPDADTPYVNTAIRRRVTDVGVRGYPMTGEDRPRGWVDASHAAAELLPEFDQASRPADLDYESRSAVRNAVASLACPRDRTIVWLHIWLDMTMAEVGPRVGLTRGGVSSRWSSVIAPQLRDALAGAL